MAAVEAAVEVEAEATSQVARLVRHIVWRAKDARLLVAMARWG